ncbi:hypothetical protein N0V92_010004 [Colletotrichum tropicale]|nr:hypothetical protein N0V92_010004 [Colletotrichum tropicale]
MSVVVVGAGPVGLSIAVRLAHAGIKVHVIEKNDVVDSSPRAAGYFGGALIAIQRTNILEKAKAIGFSADGMCWRQPILADEEGSMAMGHILARFDFPKEGISAATGHVSSLYLPQSQLTQLLLDEAISTGLVEIHFNSVLTNILQDEESVTAMFSRSATNSEEALQAEFLVGSDGGRSTTRRLLDIPFKGHSWPERLVAIDCLFQMPPGADNSTTSFIVHPIHFGLITPIEPVVTGRETTYRVVIALDPADSRPDTELATDMVAKALLDKMLPGKRPLDVRVLRVAPYKTHQLCAATFKRGRCVLAGDAAHLNNVGFASLFESELY